MKKAKGIGRIISFVVLMSVVVTLLGCFGDLDDPDENSVLPTPVPTVVSTPTPTAIPTPIPTVVPTPAPTLEVEFSAGAAGVGDPYYPNDGNTGYDVKHYSLDVRYDPETDRLDGIATVTATALQNLSGFNFDLEGLKVAKVSVNGEAASWKHNDTELTITPPQGMLSGSDFELVVEYGGIPTGKFLHDKEGALILGQPHIAAYWFPVNDHPTDIASYKLSFTVPDAYQVAANGKLLDRSSDGGWTTWVWDAQDPMASYLVGVAITQLEIREYEKNGIYYLDAVQKSLLQDSNYEPVSGSKFVASGQGNLRYSRLSRVIFVPKDGAHLEFKVQGKTEVGYDFFVIEARTAKGEDWTTLPEKKGRMKQDLGYDCGSMLSRFPAIENYITDDEGSCLPKGKTGEWWAFNGELNGVESWSFDLSAWSGKEVEFSLSYITSRFATEEGIFIDDIVVSSGEGSTSFESDADPFDGWQVSNPFDAKSKLFWAYSEPVVITSVGKNAFSALFMGRPLLTMFS